jgi:uncharacterized membrane protein YfcA
MHDLIIFAAIGTLGILVQSFFGFAGSLTAIPLFSLFFPVRDVLPAYTLVMIAIDIWLVLESRDHVQWGKAAQLLPAGCIGVFIGTYGLTNLPVRVINIAVGVITCTFAILFLLRVRMSVKENMPTRFSVGLVSGILQGCIGQAGPPLVLYGTAQKWDKNTFRSTLLTYFLCLFLVSIASYASFGLVSRHSWVLFLAGVVPAFLAANMGVWMKDRVSDTRFRQAILLVVLAVGVIGMLRAFR